MLTLNGVYMNVKSKDSSKRYYEKNKAKVIARSEKWRIENKEKINEIRRKYNNKPERKAKMREYYLKNKDKICARTKNHHQKPEQKAKSKLRSPLKILKRWEKKYGITLEKYNKMLEKQNYVCAICYKPETAYDSRLKITRKLAVDHCHKTGKIRGLLCNRCNLSIGKFEDNIEIIKSVILYLSS